MTANNCFSLTSSQYCPDWQLYQVLSNGQPFQSNVQSFDLFMASQLDSNQQFTSAFSQSIDCIDIATQAGCNQNIPATQQQICKSSVIDFINSANTIFANNQVCSGNPSATAYSTRSNLITSATRLLNDLNDNGSNCIVAATGSQETMNCGYYDAAAALNYCNTATDPEPCCSTVQGFTGTVSPNPPTLLPITTPGGTGGTAPSSSKAGTTTSASGVTTSTKPTSSAAPATTTTTTTTPPNQAAIQSSLSAAAASSSAAAAAAAAAAANNNAGTILGLQQPVFIGAVGGGAVVLIAVIVGIAMFVARSRNAKRQRMDSMDMSDLKPPMPQPQQGSYNNYSNNNTSNGGGPGMYGGGGGPIPVGTPSQNNSLNGGFQDSFGGGGAPIPPPQNTGSTPVPGGIPLPPGIGGGLPMGAGNNNNNQMAETMEVVFNYVPNLSDEIYLYVGDPVIVKCKFDDGWGFGFNMTTKMEGSFPLACVAAYSDASQPRGDTWADGSGRNINRESFSIRQRQSSMYGPPAGFSMMDGGNGQGGQGGFEGMPPAMPPIPDQQQQQQQGQGQQGQQGLMPIPDQNQQQNNDFQYRQSQFSMVDDNTMSMYGPPSGRYENQAGY